MSKLLSDVSDNVQVLTFNRPETKNAFDVELFELLRDSLNSAKDNSDIFSVIVTGSNDTFSSGVDLTSMLGNAGNDYEEPFETCIDALVEFNKPLIASVNGVAVGGGATILLHFDSVFISPSAKIKYPFSDLGLVPEVGSSYLLSTNKETIIKRIERRKILEKRTDDDLNTILKRYDVYMERTL